MAEILERDVALVTKDSSGNTVIEYPLTRAEQVEDLADAIKAQAPSPANMKGATASEAGTAGLVPAPAAAQNNLPLCGDALFKVLPIAGGGTGASNAVTARANLGINSAIGINPTGTIIAFAGNSLPDGYLVCNGAAISRTTYADLFAVIGTTYGAGNGSSTFNLPNLINRFIEGSSAAGSYIAAGLPDIIGGVAIISGGISNVSGAFYRNSGWTTSHINAPLNGEDMGLEFSAKLFNPIYGNSNTVQPASVTMNYLIKY